MAQAEDSRLLAQLSEQIQRMDHDAEGCDNATDREKFRRSAFRLRTMQAESQLYQLVGKHASLAKFRNREAAEHLLDALATHARTAGELAQVAQLRHGLQRSLYAVTLPFVMFAVLILIGAVMTLW
ncbi:hypothetical protein [Leeia aquatica]|uniref:Uncharacterized protein n=1 Tax=Leeia aquatica TaxID=2725557 RepID=A0A847SHM2_9NEIS|nr:hypothetical protein [Leeia aquatica]NLR76866.1 hypothetical protein [Leeia aquatica]